MSLFTSTDAKNFESQLSKYTGLMEKERLSKDDVLKKKQYVQICSLKLETSNHKYSDLASLLNVSDLDRKSYSSE